MAIDGLIDRWAEEAIADLGDKGWRDIDPNSMILIIYAVQKSRDKKLVYQVTRPIWWLLGVIGTLGIWWMINGIIGIAS